MRTRSQICGRCNRLRLDPRPWTVVTLKPGDTLDRLQSRSIPGRPLMLSSDGALHLCPDCVTAMSIYGGVRAN